MNGPLCKSDSKAESVFKINDWLSTENKQERTAPGARKQVLETDSFLELPVSVLLTAMTEHGLVREL